MFLKNMRASTGALWNLPHDFNDVATVPSVTAGINHQAPLPAAFCNPNFCNPNFSYNHPFSVPFGLAAASDHSPLSSLEYIANVSFVNYLALVLCINFFLSPPSCRSQEDPSLLLITLVRRLSKLFLLVYNYFQSRYDNMPTDNSTTPLKDVDGDSMSTSRNLKRASSCEGGELVTNRVVINKSNNIKSKL